MPYKYLGREWTVKELAQSEHNKLNIKPATLTSRLNAGWSVADALKMPVVIDRQAIRSKTPEGHPDTKSLGDYGVVPSLLDSLTSQEYGNLDALTSWELRFVACGALVYETVKSVAGLLPLKVLVDKLKVSEFDQELVKWSINTLIAKGILALDKTNKTVRLIEPEPQNEATSPDPNQQP